MCRYSRGSWISASQAAGSEYCSSMETTDPIFLSIVSVAIAALGLALAFGSWWTAQRALAKATERDDREVIVYLHDAFAQKSEARAALHRAYRERGPDWWRHEDEGGLDQANILSIPLSQN